MDVRVTVNVDDLVLTSERVQARYVIVFEERVESGTWSKYIRFSLRRKGNIFTID